MLRASRERKPTEMKKTRTERTIMEPRISIITLGVTDFIRSLHFYRDGLGWPTRATDDSDIAFFNTAGIRFAIFPLHKLAEDISAALPPTRSGFSGITLAHNVRTREEVAQVLAHAEADCSVATVRTTTGRPSIACRGFMELTHHFGSCWGGHPFRPSWALRHGQIWASCLRTSKRQ